MLFAALSICQLLVLSIEVHSLEQKSEEDKLWDAIRSPGHVVLMRHAIAPGTGDPDNFDVNDCGTQRILSEKGRQQATHIGDRFRLNGIAEASIYSSAWCRCLDTAALLNLGAVTKMKSLGSFYQSLYDLNPTQMTKNVRQWLVDEVFFKNNTNDIALRPVIMVTHQVNITALTGVYPSSGEMVVAAVGENGELDVLGTIRSL